MRGVVVRCVVALVLMPVLSACGGDDSEPEPTPIIASPTATPTPTPVESETAAAEETPEEFIERFFEASDEMHASGEDEGYLALTKGCRSCDELARTVTGIYADGGTIRNVRWEVTDIKPRAALDYDALVNVGPSKLRRSASAKWELSVGGEVSFHVRLDRVAEKLRVITMSVAAE